MKLVFLETPLFTRLLGDYLTDESYGELQRALMENPEMGDVMPGTGGVSQGPLGRRTSRQRQARWIGDHLLLPDGRPSGLVLHCLRQR